VNPLEVALQPVARILNRNIESTTPARKLCRELAGSVVGVGVTNTALTAWFIIHDDHLELTTETQDDADITISGSLITLARMATDGDMQSLRSGSLQMSGDPVLAEKFQQLLDLAKPDLEEELSGIVGDAAAHQIGQFARSVGKWGAEARTTMASNIREYLQEESRDLPSRYEMERFTSAVDVLRDDVDRLATRVRRLQEE
jgi:ubiquinone biosynthesis protein UbiJ